MNILKQFLIFALAMFIGLLAVNIYQNYSKNQTNNVVIATPMPSDFKFDPTTPPSKSLTATVSNMSGKIKWQSREATEPAEIKTLSKIQQGEDLATEDNSEVQVEFPSVWKINLSQNSELEFSQTLPENLVVTQKSGSTFYQKLGSNILSIRALNLLINQDSGSLTVSISKDFPIVILQTTDGSATISYEDSNNISQKTSLAKNQKLTFDDSTRTITIK